MPEGAADECESNAFCVEMASSSVVAYTADEDSSSEGDEEIANDDSSCCSTVLSFLPLINRRVTREGEEGRGHRLSVMCVSILGMTLALLVSSAAIAAVLVTFSSRAPSRWPTRPRRWSLLRALPR